MSDEDMVAYLARCQLDPAGAARVDRDAAARLRPRPARAPHAPGRDQRARGHARRRAADPRVLRRRGGLGAVHPPGLHAVQAGRRGGARQPGSQARGAGQARADRVGRDRRGGVPQDDRGHQPGGRRSSTSARATCSRFGGRKARARRVAEALLPAIRGAVSSEESKVLTVDTSERVLEFVCSEQAARLVQRRRAVSGSPRAHQAAAAVGLARGRDAGADRRARRRLPGGLPRLLRGPRRRGRRAGRPRPADRARRGHGAGGHGHHDQGVEDLARPLPPRDRGHGGRGGAGRVRVARRRGELRHRVLAAGALQARAGAASRRAAGQGRAGHRRRGRDRPRDHRHAGRGRRVRGGLRPRRRRRGARRSPTTATAGSRSPAT